MMKFDLVIDANRELTETPIWDDRNQKLYWTDLFSGDIHEYDPQTGADKTWATGELIGSAVPCQDPGKLLCAIERGICLLDKATGQLEVIADPNGGNPDNRYNDTRVDAAGRVFASTVSRKYGSDAYQPTMLGAYYMVDTDRSVTTRVEGINQYNAIVWNRDNTKMFVVDTYHCKLLAFDYDLAVGPTSGPREVIDFGGLGMPDGMSIDSEDNLYVCHWTGHISVWTKELQLAQTIDFPVEQVCCTGFGGEDRKDLYVATARYAYTPQQLADRRGAGGIFRARVETAGTLDHFFK